ncbi:hypothetical protein PTNB85_00028 [Pyrenophora teres f. teres]|nr:hypothetical protein PTNB85_00028 [Pyrenophora teres f. teres]KAE8852361.1 hypothetical protein HRS9122_02648 [Pyrenophora teres f. teres]
MATLRSIYQQYKHDTDVVASRRKHMFPRLRVTHVLLSCLLSRSCYDSQISRLRRAPRASAFRKKSQRLKGKARKLAKNSDSAQTATANQASKPKYTLAIRGFIPLSDHIANANGGAVDVPDYFKVALERVISVRSSFSEKLEAAGRAINQAAESRHAFFVTVLMPCLQQMQVPRIALAKQKFETCSRSWMYTSLQPSFWPHPTEVEYTVEVPDDIIIKAFFAMTTLIDDLSRLRAEVAELWAKHNAGELDLATVSVATNTAIELARSLEANVYPAYKHFNEIIPFHELSWAGICHSYEIDIHQKKSYADDYNYNAYDLADAFFINSRKALRVFPGNYSPGDLANYNGKWGRFDEKASKLPTSNKDKYLRDKSTLQEMLQDLPLLHNRPGIVEDQFVFSFAAARESYSHENTKPPPVWTAFAAQIYFNILYSTKVGAGWEQMRNTAASLQRYVNAHPQACTNLKTVLKPVNEILAADPIATMRRALGSKYTDYTIWRRNPTTCVPGAVMYTTQLYHALRQENLLSREWGDLQLLWNMQGNSTYFVGEPPKDFEGHWKNYLMSTGASLSNWAFAKRNTKVKVTNATRRKMFLKGPASLWIASRIQTNGDGRLLTVQTISDAITADEQVRSHHDAADAPSGLRQDSVIHKLAATIEVEIEDITFDYFAMHDICWELLGKMRDECRLYIAERSATLWESQKEHLPFIVGFVFSTAAGRKNIETKDVPNQELLKTVTDVTNAFLEEGKGIVITGRQRKI